MSRTAIVVPCFNEAARLPVDRFLAFARSHADVDFVLVDDGSTDDTARLLDDLEQRMPERFRVYRLDRNAGKAEAVRRGMLEAFSRGPAMAGYWDADLAAPLEELVPLREILRTRPELQIVLGSRVKLLGRQIDRRLLRHYPGRLFATLASQALGLPVYDTQCGAKLFRCGEQTRALFEAPFAVGWTFDVEILARWIGPAGAAGRAEREAALYEQPLRRWTGAGDSKVRSSDFLRAIWELRQIHRAYRR